jgi:hypothetical protein
MMLTGGLTDHHFCAILMNESLEKISLRMLIPNNHPPVRLGAILTNREDPSHFLSESLALLISIRGLMPASFKKMFRRAKRFKKHLAYLLLV